MAREPLTHAPTLTRGTGYQEVRRFYEHHYIPGWPSDAEVTPISRTADQGSVVDELIPDHYTPDHTRRHATILRWRGRPLATIGVRHS